MYEVTVIISKSNDCKVRFTPQPEVKPGTCETTRNGFKFTCFGPNAFLGVLTRTYTDGSKLESLVVDRRRSQ